MPPFRDGMFAHGAVKRAFAPLITPLQKRLCRCLKNMPSKTLPSRLRFRLSTTPMNGSGTARLAYEETDNTPPCLSALMACVGTLRVAYKSWYLPGCTPGSTAIITGPLHVVLRPPVPTPRHYRPANDSPNAFLKLLRRIPIVSNP